MKSPMRLRMSLPIDFRIRMIISIQVNLQIYIKFPNYTQTNKFFVGTHAVRPKKYRGMLHEKVEKQIFIKEIHILDKIEIDVNT